MNLSLLLKNFPHEKTLETLPRAYINHSVQFKKICSPEMRTKVLEEVGLNIFYFPSEMVTGCDLLSDSGVTTMTSEQWAALHKGDEAYGSNAGYFLLRDQIRETFGEDFWHIETEESPNAFLFHQGRAAEDAFFSHIGKLGDNLIIPSNGHFDTTEANITANKIEPQNLFCEEFKDESSSSYFKGNMHIGRLQSLLETSANRIPLVFLTITNNTGGGQPVSLQNIREVAELLHSYDIPLFLDACRFAENAWFIQQHESEYQEKRIPAIVKEIFSHGDGFTMSFKKDGLVNMGGGLFIKHGGLFHKKYPKMLDDLMNYQIMKEGHPTYGGLSGRDIMTLVYGLKQVTEEEYLTARIRQVQNFGKTLADAGVPVLQPFGGHAVYIDMNRFFAGTKMTPGDFGGISFTALLLAGYGHRACELGNFAFGSYDSVSQKETFPEVNFVRLAVPRLRYEEQDLTAAAQAIQKLFENRDKIPPVDVIYGKELSLRHFKARFRFRA
ncbi:tryptophanase [Candidatus Peregrinibacteria bacterium]|nr:tryptophanase [Candidatus Peregrinibacteria bacterium]